jgi:hypothetical protein
VEIIIKGEAKEIAALVSALQEQQAENEAKELRPGMSVVLNRS